MKEGIKGVLLKKWEERASRGTGEQAKLPNPYY
jgi:hypothetical protein